MYRALRTLVTTAVLGSALAARGVAQETDPDMREIMAYKLTTEGVTKFRNAMRYISEEVMKDPKYRAQMKLKAQIDSLQKKDELSEAEQTKLDKLREQLEQAEARDDRPEVKTLADMAAQAERFPPVAIGLRRAGLGAREYAVFSLALFQAVAYEGMLRAGTIKTLPKDANPANVAFVREHQAEIQALSEELKKAGESQP